MSGHSKWHNIKEKKSKTDSARGQVFTRVSKEIHMAVKEGGADPASNFRLKIAIQRAKEVNMPADNIKRTIQKASGADATNYEQLIYEGYGPSGVAIMIEIATDNRNRSAAAVRNALSKHGGALGESGCVSYMFAKKGVLMVSAEGNTEDSLMEVVLDAGGENIEESSEGFEITCAPSDFVAVKTALDEAKIECESAEIAWVPDNYVEVNEETAAKIEKLIDALDSLDDVQNVYSNYEEKE